MAGFTENALVRKLQELNSSQQSIQTLSLWLIHHRKHHAAVVKTWFKEFMKVKDGRQLTFMYLANDVIQNSKKKGPEYGKEFGEVLGESFKHMAKTGINGKTKHSLHRILNIWQERGVYDAQKIQDFKVAVDPNDAVSDEKTEKTPSKRKSGDDEGNNPEPEKKKKKSEFKQRRQSETVEVDGTIETHTTLSPKTPPGDPPESDELVKALLELEHSASSDEAVRERIASLPPEVSEIGLLSKLQGMHATLAEEPLEGLHGIPETVYVPSENANIGSSRTVEAACLPAEQSNVGQSPENNQCVPIPEELYDEDFLARLSCNRPGGLKLHELQILFDFQAALRRQRPYASILDALEEKRQEVLQFSNAEPIVESLKIMSPSDQFMFLFKIHIIKDVFKTNCWLKDRGVDVRKKNTEG